MLMLVLENPHWGRSGVPFINNTMGLEATALSIVALVSADRCRSCAVVSVIKGLELKSAGRKACRLNCRKVCKVYGRFQLLIQDFRFMYPYCSRWLHVQGVSRICWAWSLKLTFTYIPRGPIGTSRAVGFAPTRVQLLGAYGGRYGYATDRSCPIYG